MDKDSPETLLGLRSEPLDELGWVELTRKGVPAGAIGRVARSLGWSVQTLARSIDVPVRTVYRRKGARGRLPKGDSEPLIRLVRVFARAKEVLGEPSKALAWLEGPIQGLGGRAPRNLLDTDIGGELVMLELSRLEHGIFS